MTVGDGRANRAVTAAVIEARRRARKYDIPEDVRRGRARYHQAVKRGQRPDHGDLMANREYERLRWAQLPTDVRQREMDRSNAARSRRLGRPVRARASSLS